MTSPLALSTQARKRLQAGELILDGYDNEEISEIVKVSVRSVSRWRKKINENNEDLCALLRKKGSGRQSSLTEEQKQQLKEIILKGAVAAGYPHERWTSKIVADLVQKVFDITLAPRTIRQLLPTLGLSAQMPTVQSRKRDEKAVRTWIEETLPKIKKK